MFQRSLDLVEEKTMKRMACLMIGLWLLYVVGLPVMAQEGEKKEEPKKEEPKAEETKKAEEPDVPPPPARCKSLEEAVQKAEFIFVGVVDYVGDKPGSWGNPPYRPNSQFIRYEDVKFLKGQWPKDKLTVVHELFQGAKTAASTPGLNPQIFDVDKKVIVLADRLGGEGEDMMCIDADYGAMAWTEELEKKIAGMIK
jgi:hypothetical protein